MIKLDKKQIIDLLPHREPMLLIDELYDIKKLSSAIAVVDKKVVFFQGHFQKIMQCLVFNCGSFDKPV